MLIVVEINKSFLSIITFCEYHYSAGAQVRQPPAHPPQRNRVVVRSVLLLGRARSVGVGSSHGDSRVVRHRQELRKDVRQENSKTNCCTGTKEKAALIEIQWLMQLMGRPRDCLSS